MGVIDPGAGAIVMGTGIVSVSLHLAHFSALSNLLLVLATAAWVIVALGLCFSLARAPGQLRATIGNASSLTLVAGTAVLASRLLLAGLGGAAIALLILAALLWPVLSLSVLRRGVPSTGSSFLLTVAVQSLAVFIALEAVHSHHGWLTWVALAGCVLGLATYLPLLARFDLSELAVGAGDQWVAGGALAISALALGELAIAAKLEPSLRGAVPGLHAASVVVWAASIPWLVVLFACELRFVRPRYDLRRFSTVFPLGMYAACSFVVGRSAAIQAIDSFGAAWTWVSLVVWIAVVAGLARQLAA